MIHAVDVTCAQCKTRKPTRCRLAGHDGNMWRLPLSVTNEIQSLCS